MALEQQARQARRAAGLLSVAACISLTIYLLLLLLRRSAHGGLARLRLPPLSLPPLRLPVPYASYLDGPDGAEPAHPPAPDDAPSPRDAAKALWARLQPLIEQHPPRSPALPATDDVDFAVFDRLATGVADDVLGIAPANLIQLRDAHAGFVAAMRDAFPVYHRPRNAAARGIVMTASSYYLPIALVAVDMLRKTGSRLPVEIWLKDRDDYEPDVCERVAPTRNARCFVMEDIFRHKVGKKPLKSFVKFEYKVFALLFSSFQDVLFMDADNIALDAPELLFDDDPFRLTGMVMWPDVWRSSVSASYYLINGRQQHELKARPATESGQMLFSKATHLQALLLAAYYNFYGESHYYTLLVQNGPGRGDKETFIPAAESLGLSYWQVHQQVEPIGRDYGEVFGGLWWLGLIQWDPMQDFHRHRHESTGNIFNDTKPDTALTFDSFDDDAAPRPFFIHCNSRKWNPKDVLDYSGGYDLAWDMEGQPMMPYTDPPALAAQLGDLHARLWSSVLWLACDAKADFKDWQGKGKEICDRVYRYFFTTIDPKDDVLPYIPPPNEAFLDWVQAERAEFERQRESEAAEGGEEGSEAAGETGDVETEQPDKRDDAADGRKARQRASMRAPKRGQAV